MRTCVLRSGSRLGDYPIERLLAQGIRTDIFQARHEPTGQMVALRCLDSRRSPNPAREEGRFRAGLNRVLHLKGQSIPAVLDGGVTGGILWLASELKSGEPIAIQAGEISYVEALGSVNSIIDALLIAHEERGVIHGDLRPESIFVSAWEEANVLGVGCARLFGLPRKVARSTPLYRAPEQLTGKGPVDVRSDIYSFGMILYALLAGRPPFANAAGELPEKRALVAIAEHGGPSLLTPLTAILGHRAKEAWNIVEGAINPDPEKRFSSWKQVRSNVGNAALTYLGHLREERERTLETLMCLHDKQGTGDKARELLASLEEQAEGEDAIDTKDLNH